MCCLCQHAVLCNVPMCKGETVCPCDCVCVTLGLCKCGNNVLARRSVNMAYHCIVLVWLYHCNATLMWLCHYDCVCAMLCVSGTGCVCHGGCVCVCTMLHVHGIVCPLCQWNCVMLCVVSMLCVTMIVYANVLCHVWGSHACVPLLLCVCVQYSV